MTIRRAMVPPVATAMFAQIGLSGEFLKLKKTRALFRQEQHIPSSVIDRSARGSEPARDAFTRARARGDISPRSYRGVTMLNTALKVARGASQTLQAAR